MQDTACVIHKVCARIIILFTVMNRRYTDTLQSKESRQCHRRVVAATMTIVSVRGSPCKSIRLFSPTVKTSVLCIEEKKGGWILIDFECPYLIRPRIMGWLSLSEILRGSWIFAKFLSYGWIRAWEYSLYIIYRIKVLISLEIFE